MKKSLFKHGLLALSILALVGCGGNKESTDPNNSNITEDNSLITLKFWNGFTGKDGEGMDEIVKSFNKEYDGKYKSFHCK